MLPNEGLVFFGFVFSVLCAKTRQQQANATDGVLIYYTTEERPIGTTVGKVASDAGLYKEFSSDVLQKLTYTITSSGGSPNATEYLSIDDWMGILRVRKTINRDVICPQRTDCDMPFSVLVQPKEYFRVIKVNVAVADINDYTPTFDPPYFNISISESSAIGEVCLLPPATDLDSPANGVVGYSLEPDRDPFRLIVYNTSGILEPRLNLTLSLDRETQAFYSLKLIAIDGGSPQRTGSLVLEITVLDVNDNTPAFDQSVYVVNVAENASVGSELVTVHATDKDSGSNGRIVYSFSQRSQTQFGTMFRMDPQSGRVTLLHALNAAEFSSYNLSVQATDGSSEALVGFAALRIFVVVQQNANTPPAITVNFLNGEGVARIQEFSDSGAFVALVSIVVQNSQTTARCFVNETLNFLLLPLLASEYKMVTARPLDASVQSVYWVSLTCALTKDASINSTKVFPVFIIPSPVRPPVFLNSSYSAKVPAYTPPNTVVLGVRTEPDPSSGRNLTVAYAVDRDSGGRFDVDPQSGVLTTTETYFRASDVGTTVDFHVVALYRQLGNNVTSRTAIRVTVIDGDVRPPKFQQKYYNFSAPETTNPDSPVGSVVANASRAESVSYSLTTPSEVTEASPGFRINETTGFIYATGVLNSGEKARYELSVVARNARFSDLNDTTKVEVYVLENRPEITFSSSNTVRVSTSSTGGTLVATVTARLPLAGLAVCLSLSTDHADLFSIGAQSGEIRLRSNLSQFANQTLSLEIQAFVCSSPFARSSKTLSLTVVDSTELGPSSSPANDGDGDSRRTVIVASVLGVCLVVLLLVVVAVFVVCRRRSRRRQRSKASNETLYVTTALTPPQPQRSYPMVFDQESRRPTLDDITLELPKGSTQFVGSEELDGDSGYPSNSSSSQTSSDDGGGGGGGGGAASMVDGRGRDYPTTASSFTVSSGKDVGGEIPVFTTATSSSFYGTEVAKWVRASANSLSDRWSAHRRSTEGPSKASVAPAAAAADAQPTILKPSLSRSGSLASRKSIRFAADGTMIIDAKKRVTFAEEDQFRELVFADSDDVTDSPRSNVTDDDISSETSSCADSESRQTVINTIANSYATGTHYPPAGVTFGNFRPEDGSLV